VGSHARLSITQRGERWPRLTTTAVAYDTTTTRAQPGDRPGPAYFSEPGVSAFGFSSASPASAGLGLRFPGFDAASRGFFGFVFAAEAGVVAVEGAPGGLEADAVPCVVPGDADPGDLVVDAVTGDRVVDAVPGDFVVDAVSGDFVVDAVSGVLAGGAGGAAGERR